MKPVAIVAVVFGLLAVCCCGSAIFFTRSAVTQGVEVNREAQQYAREAIVEIARAWDPDVLDQHTNAQYKRLTSRAMNEMILNLSRERLGSLLTLGEPRMTGINMSSGTQGSRSVVALTFPATFEQGAGEFHVTVVKEGDEWSIEGFRIQSPKFDEAPAIPQA
jgi:hypothetical protein